LQVLDGQRFERALVRRARRRLRRATWPRSTAERRRYRVPL